MSFAYQAGSWEKEENCICKVESTGKGLNIRYIISNIPKLTARKIYTEFYVKRGDASENRSKDNYNKRKIYYHLSKSFVYKDLFRELIAA